MVLTMFDGVGVGFGFGVGCGFGIGWGFGDRKYHDNVSSLGCGMPLNVLGMGAGGGCGVGLGLGWGFGTAYGSKYRSSRVAFQGIDFGSKGGGESKELANKSKNPKEIHTPQ